jgi:CHAD domain-containing protein
LLEGTAQDPKVRTAVASGIVVEKRRQSSDERYRFEAGEAPGDGLGRIARGQLDLTISLLEGPPREDDSGAAVHDARKALKRLRALLRVSREVIDDRRYHRENVTLRDAGRALSGKRDAQVLLDTLDALAARYAEGLRERTWSRLRESLEAAVEQSMTVDSQETISLVGVLSEARDRTEAWPATTSGGTKSLAGGFARVYRRGRRALASAKSDPGTETLHELRKRAKDLWHAAQLLEPLSDYQMREFKRGAHRLSDLLGEDHDLTILREHAERSPELLTAVERELLMALTSVRQKTLRREALACAAELYRRKPKRVLGHLALA